MKTPPCIPVTVIVITLNRPDCLRQCLQAIEAQSPRPQQVIVVDASHDDRSRLVAVQFPDVFYLSTPHLFGHMTASRNTALRHATGEIIAFLDDDAYVRPGWLQSLVAAYDAPDVGAVGGRALNGQPGETERGRDEIGRLKPNGLLTGNFAADPGCAIEVDHVIGCNMSFRREVLARLGGFREDFPGISGLCEDTDMCLRVRALGYTLRFAPAACVDHVGAPQAMGERFNARYQFFHRYNSCVLLMRNFGFSAMVWRFPFAIIAQTARVLVRSLGCAFARAIASFAGLTAGICNGLFVLIRTSRDPVGHDPAAEAIRAALSTRTPQPIRPAEAYTRAGD